MKRLCLLVALLCLARAMVAAEKPSPGDREIAAYFRSQTAELAGRCLAGASSLDDWKAHRDEYRRQLQEMLGLWPMPPRTDLNPVVTGRLEGDGFTVEKVYFQASPHLYVTADLYLPQPAGKPVSAILFECGHVRVMTNGISLGNKTAYQQHGAWFAQNGYVCLVVDSLQLGEIQGLHPGTRDLGLWWWNARGYTPAGVEAWFGIRALDYLCTRPEVDTNHIGITGHSGGGAYSWTVTALDDRIKAAAPLAGMTDLQNHVVDGLVDSHCDCNFFINTYRWDFPQVAALAAPRPLLLGSEDKDRIFPLDGVLRVYEKLRRIYALYGQPNHLGLTIVEGGHADSPDFYVPVLRWFNRHLKGEDPPITTLPRKYFTPEQLKVFDALPADAINTNIQQVFVPLASPPPPAVTPEARRDRERAQLAEVRQKCFNGWPADAPPVAPERLAHSEAQGVRIQDYAFDTQPGVSGWLFVIEPDTSGKAPRVILTVLDEAGWTRFVEQMPGLVKGGDDQAVPETLFEHWRDRLESENAALAFFAPRGVGMTAWNQVGRKPSGARRRFMLLGQTLDGMRVWDIRRAVQAVRTIPGLKDAPLTLRGGGTMGVNALYAALFEPDIARLELKAIPASHVDGPTYLNILRIWDIPQALQAAEDRMTVQRR